MNDLQYLQTLLPENREEQFYIDLEFIQNLCNARYLHYLAQNGYFQQEEFLKYLQYLTYWKDPQYMKYLLFPQCLAFLDAILENTQFRNELTISEFINYIHMQQGLHWVNGRSTVPDQLKQLTEENNKAESKE
jgi:mediator of RNA polymerase II transcription subunit 31